MFDHKRFSPFGLALALLVVAPAGCVHVVPPSIPHPLALQRAPAFEGETKDAYISVPSASPRTRVTLVDFWASWCSSCPASFRVYEGMYKELGGRGLSVVGVSIDEDVGTATAAALQWGASFPIVFDRTQRLASSWRVSQLPTTFVVDQNGMVRWVGRDPTAAREAVLAVLGP